MKQGTLAAVAATMVQEFARAVESAEKEQSAAISDIATQQHEIMEKRRQRQDEIDSKRREAGELIAECLDMEAEANTEFYQAMGEATRGLSDLSQEKRARASKLKLISSRKTS
jgi:Tfp pilus tip-associated adhesin PilY1